MDETLGRYLQAWDLSDPKPLAETFTSNLYTVQAFGHTAVLKILSQIGAADEGAGADALLWYSGQGAVQLLRHDPDAMLLEYVAGPDLTDLVRAGRDDEATKIIGNVLNKLHFASSADAPNNLTPLLHRFHSLFNAADKERDSTSLFGRGAAVAHAVLSDGRPAHVLHGDIHHENIRHHQVRGWLAIDPKGLVGDRTYDAANTLCNPDSMPAIVQNRDRLLRQADIMAHAIDVDRNRLLSFVFAHSCLSASWCIEDGHDPSHALNVARIVEPCINLPGIASARAPAT